MKDGYKFFKPTIVANYMLQIFSYQKTKIKYIKYAILTIISNY